MKILLHLLALIASLTFTAQVAIAQDQEAKQGSAVSPSSSSFLFHKVSERGSVLKAGEHILFFEGLTERETAYVYKSIVYGGVVPATLSRLLYLASNRAMHGNYPLLSAQLLLASLITGPIGLYHTLVEDIAQIFKVGSWYVLPHVFYTFSNSQYPGASFYGLTAFLYSLGTLSELLSQTISDKNTQYVHIPLGGSASGKFFIRALFQDPPIYTLFHTGQNEENSEGDDVFSHLSRVLGTYDVDFLTIKPLRGADSTKVQVTFRAPDHNEDTTIYVTGRSNGGDNPGWLLHSLHDKHDRLKLTETRFALSPTLLVAMANAIDMFFTGQKQSAQGVLDRVDEDEEIYLFVPSAENGVTALVDDITHQEQSSEFVMGNGELVYHWSDGYFWPKLRLVPALPGDPELTQWWIPKWIGQLLVAETANRGKQLAYSTTTRFAERYVMPRLLVAAPTRRLRFTFAAHRPEFWLEPVAVNDVSHFDLVLAENQVDPNSLDHCSCCFDEITNAGRYKTPCCQQVYLCPECQQTWSRQQYDAAKYSLDPTALPLNGWRGDVGIRLDCMIPSCKRGVPAVIHTKK